MSVYGIKLNLSIEEALVSNYRLVTSSVQSRDKCVFYRPVCILLSWSVKYKSVTIVLPDFKFTSVVEVEILADITIWNQFLKLCPKLSDSDTNMDS